MPKAVIDITETERLELKSCPGGYVVLRRLSYGQWLSRQQDSMTMSVVRTAGNNGSQDAAADIKMMQRKVAVIEFAQCIVEHNLEGSDGQRLDFRQEYTLDILDPRIGQEIGDKIREMNEIELNQGN